MIRLVALLAGATVVGLAGYGFAALALELRVRREIRAWKELEADPAFRAGMDRARADFAAGRAERWTPTRGEPGWVEMRAPRAPS